MSTTDWSDPVTVTCTYNEEITLWSDPVTVTCTYNEEITPWSDPVTVTCTENGENTHEEYEQLYGKFIGNHEYAKQKSVERAERLAIIRVMSRQPAE